MVVGNERRFQVTETFPIEWAGTGATYDVEQVARAWNVSAFEWSALLTGTTATGQTIETEPGTTYCFHARSRDVTGNESSWSDHSCTTTPVNIGSLGPPFDEPPTGWKTEQGAGHYMGDALVSAKKGSSLRVPIGGAEHAAVVVEKCAGCGSLAVYSGEDGAETLLRTISLNRRTTNVGALVPIPLPATTARNRYLILKVISARRRVVVDGLGLDRLGDQF
jgi:hypothetical protein